MAALTLASAADHSSQATNQIVQTMQQIASGTAQQTESVAQTAHSVEEMRRAIATYEKKYKIKLGLHNHWFGYAGFKGDRSKESETPDDFANALHRSPP